MKSSLVRYQCIINPGYLVVSKEPTLLCSVCGSGVIVVIWDKIKRSGGMAHCVYPKVKWGERATNYHADIAIPSLLRQMFSFSSSGYSLEAQIFGGGDSTGAGFARKRAAQVLKSVRGLLKKSRINVVSEDVGGSLGRKVMFNTHSGDVIVIKTKKVRQADWAPDYGALARSK
jgi:chemotaxis protein CheD